MKKLVLLTLLAGCTADVGGVGSQDAGVVDAGNTDDLGASCSRDMSTPDLATPPDMARPLCGDDDERDHGREHHHCCRY